jgi:hypothetical protein
VGVGVVEVEVEVEVEVDEEPSGSALSWAPVREWKAGRDGGWVMMVLSQIAAERPGALACW